MWPPGARAEWSNEWVTITIQAAGPETLRFEVSGPVAPLLRALADKDVVTLTSREPSLEEIFLHHYGGADAAPG